MFNRTYLSLILGAAAVSAYAGGNIMVDDGQPWGAGDNYQAANDVFGANWSETNTGTPASSVFNSSNSFVWLIFSAQSDLNGQAYMSANNGLINSWVAGGGKLFYMSAPWDYSGPTLLPGGETELFDQSYDLASYTGNFTASAGATALMSGPFGNTSGSWFGNYFSHAILTGPAQADMTGTSGTIVAEEGYGLGTITFATWTDPTFWSGPVGGQALLDNALYHAAVPEPAPIAALGLGALGLLIRRRKS